MASRYERLIYACCHRRLIADTTEDVVGDTLLMVYAGLPRFRGGSRLSSWVWTIAYHQGVDPLRSVGDAEVAMPGINGKVFRPDLSDVPGKGLFDLKEATIEVGLGPLGEQFDAAVREVSHIPAQCESSGDPLRRIAKTNALHATDKNILSGYHGSLRSR